MAKSRKADRTNIKHVIEFIGAKILIFLLWIFPCRFSISLGGFFGKLAWHIGIRRKVARRNFSLCFGDKYTEKERDAILKKSYDYFIRTSAEFIILPRILKKDYIVNVNDFEYLENFARERKGVVLFTGHLGNWEFLGSYLVKRGIPLDVIVARQRNKFINSIIEKMRNDVGMGLIYFRSAVKQITKSLLNGRMVAFLADQDAGEHGEIVNFLGNPASTHKGPAVFALKTRLPIIIGFMIRQEDGYHQDIYILPPIYINQTGDFDADVHEITQQLVKVLEEAVEKHPEQYFWAHRRFKSTLDCY